MLVVQRFKFSGARVAEGSEETFVHDLLASAEFQAAMERASPLSRECLGQLEVRAVPCTVTSLRFFDFLEAEGLIAANGYLKKCMNDRVAGVELDTLVTDLLLNEDSEHAGCIGEAQRAEFIFQLFHLFFVGGAMHQRDEEVSGYLEQTKAMYKDLLSVHKKAGTGKVEVTSRVFRVHLGAAALASGGGGPLFPGGVAEHCRCFVVLDPVKKYATVMHSNYKTFW